MLKLIGIACLSGWFTWALLGFLIGVIDSGFPDLPRNCPSFRYVDVVFPGYQLGCFMGRPL